MLQRILYRDNMIDPDRAKKDQTTNVRTWWSDAVALMKAALPRGVTLEAKLALAGALRQHYRAHPAALELQAAAEIVPPTVANHR